nr:ankyrin repeat-containing protein [Tanacetum cinerariifolium]
RSTMVRAADLELEFNQYQENTNAYLTTLENELAAMRLEANQHHEQSNQRHDQSTKKQKEMMKPMKKNSDDVESTKGLKPDLRASVRVMHPEGLNRAMILAVTLKENKGFDNEARGGG